MYKFKFLAGLAFILAATCLQAQKTPLQDVYIDNNQMVTISFLSPRAAAHGLLDGVTVPLDSAGRKDANVAFHYPLHGRVEVTAENGAYRITVYNMYFDASGLALPVEAFAMTGKRLTRNEKRLKSVIILRGFIYKYFIQKSDNDDNGKTAINDTSALR